MPETQAEIQITDWDDIPVLRQNFIRNGRIQLRRFLALSDAKRLNVLLSELEWRLVLNEGEKHFDIHPTQAKLLGRKKLRLIKMAGKARAKSEFQYLFENYPVYDVLQSGQDVDPAIKEIYDRLNSQPFLQQLSQLTGEQVDFCDMQATRYRTGHFLTSHDDNVADKNRKLAYVLYVSQNWRPSWGGQLEFLTSDGAIAEAYSPEFNTLSLFKVPSEHRVSAVTSKAKNARLALTGWFRTHETDK